MMRPFFMTYQDAVEWLFQQIPNFQKTGADAYKPGLERVNAFCKELGNPQNNFNSVHLAGTNGKGSVAHIMASALQANGLQVGVFTSPHIRDFKERIKINGTYISESYVLNFINQQKDFILKQQLSFFEITATLAFDYFAKQKVDIAIIETGLGGRLDATNVIQPILSVITNIGLDHQQFLGDTLQEIATEKAGIIKPNTPVVIGKLQQTVNEVFERKAKACQSEITYVAMHTFDSDLKASYQQENICTAYTALKVLSSSINLKDEKTLKGFRQVGLSTKFMGRFQEISTKPQVILDAAHNEDGVQILMNEIEQLKASKVHLIYGASSDKKVSDIIRLIPKAYHLHFCEFNSERSMKTKDFKNQVEGLRPNITTHPTPTAALNYIEIQETEVLIIFGSFFLMEEVLDYYS